MKGKVMRPFRAPREAFQRDKPDRSMEADSEEATELGLVYGLGLLKRLKTQFSRTMNSTSGA